MSVVVEAERIRLSGTAGVEDAEPLLAALLDHPGLTIDIASLTRAHMAVVQLLLGCGRPIAGRPDDPGLRAVLASLTQINA